MSTTSHQSISRLSTSYLTLYSDCVATNILLTLRECSHQESPLVHLLCSRPNTLLIFFFFGAVCFYNALFASEPEIVNKTTRVLRSSIHWFIHSTVPEFIWNRTFSAGSRYGCLVRTRVQLLYSHLPKRSNLYPHTGHV